MFERILVAVDGSTNSDRAVEAAAEMARIHDSTLSICHAFHIPEHYKTDLVDELEEALIGDAEKILSHAASVAEKANVTAETRLLKKGHPTEAIVTYAGELGVDLIVVGVRGRTPDQGRAMGSVSAAVTEQASCSVLLVKKGL
ncbi:MAG: universal stress protein [Candidatus Eisenbacteria sp.]|nr:universal stress protein [Candidatus Eisenbacteria bacterium]